MGEDEREGRVGRETGRRCEGEGKEELVEDGRRKRMGKGREYVYTPRAYSLWTEGRTDRRTNLAYILI